MLRILRIADLPDNRTGGMARAMHFSGDALMRAGHRVDYLLADRIVTNAPARLRRFAAPLRLPHLVEQLRRRGAGYDVVEIHEPLGAVYAVARQFGRRLPPMVAFSHGLEARSHLAMLKYRKDKGLSVSVKRRFSPYSVVLQAEYALKHCQQVICSSSEDRKFLLGRGVRDEQISLVPLGVGHTFLDTGRRLADIPRPAGLLFIGTWIERKGVIDLGQAVSAVLRRRSDVTLTVAGCGCPPQEVLSAFDPEVRPRVAVIPRVETDDQLVRLYAQHSVFVLPSYMEGQSLVMLEAAAMSLAIVATDTSGMRDFLRNGAGLLVGIGDVTQLAAAMERAVSDKTLARKLGDEARRRAASYTWQCSAAAMVRAYQRALARADGGSRFGSG